MSSRFHGINLMNNKYSAYGIMYNNYGIMQYTIYCWVVIVCVGSKMGSIVSLSWLYTEHMTVVNRIVHTWISSI